MSNDILGPLAPRSLAGKPLARFRATPSRRITGLTGIILGNYPFNFATEVNNQSDGRDKAGGNDSSQTGIPPTSLGLAESTYNCVMRIQVCNSLILSVIRFNNLLLRRLTLLRK